VNATDQTNKTLASQRGRKAPQLWLVMLWCAASMSSTWAAGSAEAGRGLYPVCTACHGAEGQGNRAMSAPKIAGQQGFYLLKQLQHFQSGARGAAPDDAKGRQMAAMSKGPKLASNQALEDLVAYVERFPDNKSAETVNGDTDRGKGLYVTCASCHGDRAQGLEMMAAPRLAGQNDWYLVAQLENFAAGKRGYAPSDHGGRQMKAMMGVLQNPEDYRDVVAYINTLIP
jgi:cytochrome c oxidase subunit 2